MWFANVDVVLFGLNKVFILYVTGDGLFPILFQSKLKQKSSNHILNTNIMKNGILTLTTDLLEPVSNSESSSPRHPHVGQIIAMLIVDSSANAWEPSLASKGVLQLRWRP